MGGENHEANLLNQRRYAITAWFYDILDFPWELQYRKWRPELLRDVSGKVLESGVGTGRNLKYYPAHVNLTALDLSPAMLRKASKRCSKAKCEVQLMQEDASRMESVGTGSYDWLISFFLCCVLPAELQEQAVSECARVLKPGGRFRLLEMKYSSDPRLRKRQERFAPFVRKVYGAGFDRQTLRHVMDNPLLKVTETRYLKHDVYLMIEGVKENIGP
jgi:ubiquinone/menaquinone biosynthesis C-methylase UbiE